MSRPEDSHHRRCSLADVLVPQLGIFADEAGQEFDAGRVLKHGNLDPVGLEVLLISMEGPAFPDYHVGDAVEQDGARAHRTG